MPIQDKAAAARRIDELLRMFVAEGNFRLKYRITVDPPLPEERDWERPQIRNAIHVQPHVVAGTANPAPRAARRNRPEDRKRGRSGSPLGRPISERLQGQEPGETIAAPLSPISRLSARNCGVIVYYLQP